MSLMTSRRSTTWSDATHTTHIAHGHLGNRPHFAATDLQRHPAHKKNTPTPMTLVLGGGGSVSYERCTPVPYHEKKQNDLSFANVGTSPTSSQ